MSPEIAGRNILSDARREAEIHCKPIFIDWADLPSCVGCVSLENTTYPNHPFGAAEGLLLDRANPKWQCRYFAEKFNIDNYFVKPK